MPRWMTSLVALFAAAALAGCVLRMPPPAVQLAAPCTGVRPTEIESFRSGLLTLRAQVYRPCAAGRFPIIVYAHGAEEDPGPLFDAIGPALAARGLIVFAPHRRGAGLSADQGPELYASLEAIGARDGPEARIRAAIAALEGPHLDDTAAAIDAARVLPGAERDRIYLIGNGFGGVLAMLAAERGFRLRAVANFAGAAGNWDRQPLMRERLLRAAANAHIPVYVAQAANDHSVEPTRVLGAALAAARKRHRARIWPAFGTTADDGHGFGIFGSRLWADEVLAFFGERPRRQYPK